MFPPVEFADEDGFLCHGGHLSVETLHLAYSSGIFPWPTEGYPLFWFAPPQRALLFLDELHVGSRLRRFLSKNPFEIRVDSAFEQVIAGCAAPRESEFDAQTGTERGTWILPSMRRAYTDFHRAGYAHSIEAWQDGQIVGGLYGVSIGGYFCGESMFYRAPNASKAALLWLAAHLQSHGAKFIDCQMMTPHFEAFGAREVPRAEFMHLLEDAIASPVKMF